jgi:hypothetical protein
MFAAPAASSASVAEDPPSPKQPPRAETVAKTANRECNRRRVPCNLDASPFRYYLVTTLGMSIESPDGRYQLETPRRSQTPYKAAGKCRK